MIHSSTTVNLINELRKIFDDVEFINGILVFVSEENDRKELLKFIRRGVDVDIETVTVFALDLYNAHEDI